MSSYSFLGYESLTNELYTLISTYPPPFIYVNDPVTSRLSSSLIAPLLTELANASTSTSIHHTSVNAVSCFAARLLYDTILNSLAGWQPAWENGCMNWPGDLQGDGGGQRWNENFDGFLHGLRAVHTYLRRDGRSTLSAKGKRQEGLEGNVRLVIVIERAERLKDNVPDLVVPLTRLAELSQLDLTVIFLSEAPWEDIRPPLGASPDPYFIDISPLTKETVIQRLISAYPSTPASSTEGRAPHPYHPALQPLYAHFISMLCDVCFPFTHDPNELAYIAAARWPGFVQPVLESHEQKLQSQRRRPSSRVPSATRNPGDNDNGHEEEVLDGSAGTDSADPEADVELAPPSEETRMRLTRLFSASLTNALETLYPRRMHAAEWAAAHKPPPGLLSGSSSLPVKGGDIDPTGKRKEEDGLTTLPRMSQFILVAAFIASTNPAKSDVRMFGRGVDERKRKRRARKAVVGSSGKGPAKVPQRLLGAASFPLDRLLAILGALLEENDDADGEGRVPPEFTIPGEWTETEIGRVGVWSSIMELTSMCLLHRTSAPDRIDGPPTFKCGVGYDVALAMARGLGVPLGDLLWEDV